MRGDTAVVEVEGVRRHCNLSLIREARVGDYVLIHAGFAIRKWTETDVREWREIMKELDRADTPGDAP